MPERHLSPLPSPPPSPPRPSMSVRRGPRRGRARPARSHNPPVIQPKGASSRHHDVGRGRWPARTSAGSVARRGGSLVELQQLAEGVVIGDVGGPAVRGRDSNIQRRVRISEPLRAGVVEVRQRALPELLGGILVTGNRTPRIAGDRFVHPLDPLGRVEPPVAQLDEPAGGFRDGGGARVVRVVGGGDVRCQAGRERERLEGCARRVARPVFQASSRAGATRSRGTDCEGCRRSCRRPELSRSVDDPGRCGRPARRTAGAWPGSASRCSATGR